MMKLYEVVGGVLKIAPNTLNNGSNALNTPNWDSLRHIEVMLAVENAFGIRFSMSEMVGMENLGEMRAVLAAKGVNLKASEPVARSA